MVDPGYDRIDRAAEHAGGVELVDPGACEARGKAGCSRLSHSAASTIIGLLFLETLLSK